MKNTITKNIHAITLASALCICLLGAPTPSVGREPAKAEDSHAPPASTVTREEAMDRLAKGNARFASGNLEHPRQAPSRRLELAKTQHPFATILGCADSRTGPEVVFDQGLGDLFVVRTAGNVLDDHALGSIEYSVEHLGAALVVVLGHERCGAVSAARDTIAAGGQADGHIQSLVDAIRPAVELTAQQDAEATCEANVMNMVRALRSSKPILEHLVETGKLTVVGAHYDLDTGKVTFLKD